MEYETRITDGKKVMTFKSSSLKRAMSQALDFYIWVGKKYGFTPRIKLYAYGYDIDYDIMQDDKGEWYYV